MSQAKRMDPTPDIASLSFEEALGELEQIVGGLEGGRLPLEEALQKYDRGARLRAHCEAKLRDAEARVAAIVQAPDGSLTIRRTDLEDSLPAGAAN